MLAIGAVTEYVDLAMHSGIATLIHVALWVVRQTFEIVTVGSDVRRGSHIRFFDQCTQAGFLRWILDVVAAVKLQRIMIVAMSLLAITRLV